MERFDGQSGGVLFAGGESAERVCDLRACDARGLCECETFEHGGEGGAAGERRRAAVGEEARGLDAARAEAEREAEAVAADGVRLFGRGVGVLKLARVARVGEVVFEGFGVGHSGQAGAQARSLCAFR